MTETNIGHRSQTISCLANLYRRFIKEYARLIQPISDLIRTKDAFQWGKEQDEAFLALKDTLTSAPVLAHPSSSKRVIVSTEASKHAVGATLEQDGQPIAYMSHRLSDTETRWDTGDQELLAFIHALREWSVHLRGPFTFRTDHEPIRYLQSKIILSGRQHRWLNILQEHTYEVEHVQGKLHVVPDALSCRPGHCRTSTLKSMQMNSPDFSHEIKHGCEHDT